MGPKSIPKTVAKKLDNADVVGAKICTFSVGEQSDLIRVKVNLNCTLDIGLDYAKKALITGIESKMRELSAQIDQPPVSTRSPRGDETAAPADLDRLTAVRNQMGDFKRLLESGDISKLELFDDTGTSLGCQQSLGSLGFDVLSPFSTYTVGTSYVTENGQSESSPLLVDVGDKTGHHAKRMAAFLASCGQMLPNEK